MSKHDLTLQSEGVVCLLCNYALLLMTCQCLPHCCNFVVATWHGPPSKTPLLFDKHYFMSSVLGKPS